MPKISAKAVRQAAQSIKQLQPTKSRDILEPVEGYAISVPRIFELLSNKRIRDIDYISSRTGQSLALGSETAVNTVTGIAKSAVANTLDKAQNGTWVEIRRSTFVRLAALLNQMEPGLIDPLDPLKREIRFPDREVPGLGILRGYEVLRILHERSAPSPELELPPQLGGTIAPQVTEETDSSDNNEIQNQLNRLVNMLSQRQGLASAENLDYLRQFASEESLTPPVQLPRRTGLQMKTSRLAHDLRKHMVSVGAMDNIDVYIDYLLSQKKSGFRNRSEYVADLTSLLLNDELPKQLTLTLISEYVPLGGTQFDGNVEEMLAKYDIYEDELT